MKFDCLIKTTISPAVAKSINESRALFEFWFYVIIAKYNLYIVNELILGFEDKSKFDSCTQYVVYLLAKFHLGKKKKQLNSFPAICHCNVGKNLGGNIAIW